MLCSDLRRVLTAFLVSAILVSPVAAQTKAGGGTLEASPSKSGGSLFAEAGAEATPAPSNTATPGNMSPREVYLKTLKSIAMLVSPDMKSTGTGWIVDIERRLIVTNEHVVSGHSEMKLFFPTYKDGALQTDRETLDRESPVKATVIDSVEGVDLAIVQVDELPKDAIALTLADKSASPGERTHAIGGMPQGSFGLWKYSTGFVSLVSMTSAATGSEIRVLQSNIDINPGNSGGPVVNDAGLVVGVCQSINTSARDVSYNVDVQEVRKYLDTVLKLIGDDSPQSLYQLGKRNRDAGRTRAAMDYLSRAIHADPNLLEAQVERGWAFLDLDDKVTAISDFTSVIGRNQGFSEAYRGRARAYRHMGEYEKAIADLSMAITNNPQNPHLYNERGMAQEFNEDLNLAMSDYGRAIQMAGRNAIFRSNRADLSIKMKRYSDAIVDLKVALESSPNYAWANNLMGLALHHSKDYKNARGYLLKACELDENNVQYLRDFGETLQSLGEHEMGVKAWSMAIEKDDSHAYSYYSRAWSLRRLNRFQPALQDMNRAISLYNEAGSYYFERGKIHEAMGDNASAKADFAQAARLDPESYGDAANNSSNTAPTSQDNNRTNNVNNNASPVVGRWYCKQNVNGRTIEMTQLYHANGNYECLLLSTMNGETKRTEEQGTYRLEGNNVVFDTNLGNYKMNYKMEDGLLWLLFNDLEVWLGSSRVQQ